LQYETYLLENILNCETKKRKAEIIARGSQQIINFAATENQRNELKNIIK